MSGEDKIRVVNLDGFDPDKLHGIKPQPPPSAPRIKDLMSRALTNPETLSPDEIREMTASVVYHLLSVKRLV